MNNRTAYSGMVKRPLFFDSFLLKDLFEQPAFHHGSEFKPAVNIREQAEGWLLELAAPGFEKSNFHVQFDQNVLTISYKAEEGQEQQQKFIRREFSVKNFSRSFVFPKDLVNEEGIEARYSNGVLQLSLPKKEAAKPKEARQISIS